MTRTTHPRYIKTPRPCLWLYATAAIIFAGLAALWFVVEDRFGI